MKRISFLSVLLLIFIAGCNSEQQDFTGDPTIEGYLVHVEDKEILVVKGITKEQAVNMSWNELLNENDKRYDAQAFHIDSFFDSFSDSFSEFKKGQRVRVWGKSGQRESYPPQAELGKIELAE